jgi:lipid-binding SYLF domain-containing protein
VGRDASAQTDAQMNAEILSYSRSRGLFAGIALQGATLRQDLDDNRELYGRDLTNREILHGTVHAPASAARFEALLDRNSMHKEGD